MLEHFLDFRNKFYSESFFFLYFEVRRGKNVRSGPRTKKKGWEKEGKWEQEKAMNSGRNYYVFKCVK